MDIKHLNKKNIGVFSMISTGILYLFMGVFFLTQKHSLIFAIKGLLNLLTILLIITGFSQLLGFSLLRKKVLSSISSIMGFTANIIMAAFIYYKPDTIVSILPISFGIYAISSGIIKLLIYFQYRKNDVAGRLFVLIGAIVLSFFGILILAKPLSFLMPISNLIGIFFILYGASFLIDGLIEGLPNETKNTFKRRIRIKLPVFMVAMIPHRVLKQINKALETDRINEEDFVSCKENTPADLEVLIHVGEKGTTAFGHVDIYFDGRIMQVLSMKILELAFISLKRAPLKHTLV